MCCGPGGGDAEIIIAVDSANATAQPKDAETEDGPLMSPRAPPVAESPPASPRSPTPPPPAPAAKVAETTDREPAMFTATVAKGVRPLGMDVNYHDSATLLVTRVNAGPCFDYNSANRSQMIAPGDRIVSINGISGETSQMVQACKSEELTLTIRRCEEKRVLITRKFPEQKFGMETEQCDSCTLVVVGVDDQSSESACGEYNRNCGAGRRLEKDWRIIGVNDVYGEAEKLAAEIKSAQCWALVVRQVWPK